MEDLLIPVILLIWATGPRDAFYGQSFRSIPLFVLIRTEYLMLFSFLFKLGIANQDLSNWDKG